MKSGTRFSASGVVCEQRWRAARCSIMWRRWDRQAKDVILARHKQRKNRQTAKKKKSANNNNGRKSENNMAGVTANKTIKPAQKQHGDVASIE